MTSHIIDSTLFQDLFGTAEMRRIFSDASLLQKWLDAESALAQAEAGLGIIPPAAAEEIVRKAKAELLSQAEIAKGIAETVHPIVPVIRALESVCEGEAGQYVHWGATTQDIMDTGVVLQLKNALVVIGEQMDRIERALVEHAVRYKETPMAGRTHAQHAVPITFGFKAAVWLAEWRRHQERLNQMKPRLLVGQLSGAAGTLAGITEMGLEVQADYCHILGLGVPDIAWHTSRDAFAEFCSLLGLIGGTCGKIAREIITLQRNEIGELAEPHNEGKVGSSTMPHKRNPMLCEAIAALSQIIRGTANTSLFGLVHEHERDMGPWQAEWQYIPEICINTAGCLELTARVLVGLEVRPEAMLRNLRLTDGYLCSEALMIRLGEIIGKQRAHDAVYHAAMAAHDEGIPLVDAVMRSPEISGHLTEAEVKAKLDPTQYLGWAAEFVDRVVAGGVAGVSTAP